MITLTCAALLSIAWLSREPKRRPILPGSRIYLPWPK